LLPISRTLYISILYLHRHADCWSGGDASLIGKFQLDVTLPYRVLLPAFTTPPRPMRPATSVLRRY
jgi:hypothetical protein